jgi:hypothetical protein
MNLSAPLKPKTKDPVLLFEAGCVCRAHVASCGEANVTALLTKAIRVFGEFNAQISEPHAWELHLVFRLISQLIVSFYEI